MRPIDADALIEILAEMQGRCATKAALVQNSKIWQQVKDMPTVDAEPVRHGKWIDRNPRVDIATCSCCGDRWGSTSVMKYCPSCGAKMDAQEKDDDRKID